jgi:hypothetical protein
LADSEDELQRADKAVDAAITAALELVARELLDQARSHRTEFLKRMYAVDAIRLMVPNDINEAAQRLWFLSLRKLWSFPARSSRAGKPRRRRSSPTRTRRYPIKGNGSVFGQSALLPKTTKQ